MNIHIENNLKDLLINRLEISNDFNLKLLNDLYIPPSEQSIDLNPVDSMFGDINNYIGSIHLLKLE